MNTQFKKLTDLSKIAVGDKITLFLHETPNAKTVKQMYYQITSITLDGMIKCIRLRNNGETFRDKWYDTQQACFYKRQDGKTFSNRFGYIDECYYVEPNDICKEIISRFIEDKRKINKKIVDLQHLMYNVE